MNSPTIKLSALLDGIVAVDIAFDCAVSGISVDTRTLVSGDVFIAVGGLTRSSESLVADAVKAGASVVLVDGVNGQRERARFDAEILVLSVDNLSSQKAVIYDRFYGNVVNSLSLVGITGTNGKTSVAYFVTQLRTLLNKEKQAIIGTLGVGVIDELQGATHTTPDIGSVYQALVKMKDIGVTGVNIEVSSHAMDQGRLGNLKFDVCVFTNLTRDHLDYHETMARYAAAKKQLFIENATAYSVVNIDDPYGEELYQWLAAEAGEKVISYGVNNRNASLQAHGLSYGLGGVSGVLSYGGQESAFSCQLVGAFSVSNVLAAVGVCLSEGHLLGAIAKHLEALSSVPGRMEKVVCATYKDPVELTDATDCLLPVVLVDYAHTPDALKNALQALQSHVRNDLWCVFGCGGDRDMGKRPQMGSIASHLSDVLVLTTDNPRSENPQAIIDAILEGVDGNARLRIEVDRARAIEWAVKQSKPGDVVLLAGKGHEEYQEIAGERQTFSDVKVAQKALCLRLAS